MELARIASAKLTDAVRGINACAGAAHIRTLSPCIRFSFLYLPNLSIVKMMPNSPPSSSSFSGHSAPPAGDFTFSRAMWQAPQHAKPRQTVSGFNGNQRVPINQGNSVDMPDMNGPQISVSQLSIRPSINHVLSSGYGCSSVLAIPLLISHT